MFGQCHTEMVDLPLLPESSDKVARFSPRERAQQQTFEQVEDVPRCPGEGVEGTMFTTCEQTADHRASCT